MNTAGGSFVAATLIALAVGCGPATPDPTTVHDRRMAGADGAGDADDVAGGAGGREVGAARTAGKQALADLDAEIARTLEQQDAAKDDPALRDRMVGLLHDRTALLGFLGHLERCAAGEVACPPRLDEPKVPRDYDAAEQLIRHPFAADPTAFAGAAKAIAEASCACRTRTCVEWVLADLRRWDEGLSLEDQDDEAAAASVTLARECAWDRLGY